MGRGGLTLVPGERGAVHTAGQVRCIGEHPWLGRWFSECTDSTGTGAGKLA